MLPGVLLVTSSESTKIGGVVVTNSNGANSRGVSVSGSEGTVVKMHLITMALLV